MYDLILPKMQWTEASGPISELCFEGKMPIDFLEYHLTTEDEPNNIKLALKAASYSKVTTNDRAVLIACCLLTRAGAFQATHDEISRLIGVPVDVVKRSLPNLREEGLVRPKSKSNHPKGDTYAVSTWKLPKAMKHAGPALCMWLCFLDKSLIQRAILASLARMPQADLNGFIGTYKQLAEETGKSEKTVGRVLTTLRDEGSIKIIDHVERKATRDRPPVNLNVYSIPGLEELAAEWLEYFPEPEPEPEPEVEDQSARTPYGQNALTPYGQNALSDRPLISKTPPDSEKDLAVVALDQVVDRPMDETDFGGGAQMTDSDLEVWREFWRVQANLGRTYSEILARARKRGIAVPISGGHVTAEVAS